ncbi:MAG: hypothetical protein AAGA54_04900 [Myxococcota bacterium]
MTRIISTTACLLALCAPTLGCDAESERDPTASQVEEPSGKADGWGEFAECPADPLAIETEDEALACLAQDHGPYDERDFTDTALYAGGISIDYVACVDGVLYGTAGAGTALGLGAAWTGAVLEPTPAGEVAAAAASAPMLGFLGGVVGVKISGSYDRCLVPMARLATAAAASGADWVARGIEELISTVFMASGSREMKRKLKQLARNTGADENCLSDALHDCKSMYPGDYNVDLDTRTGTLTDPRSGEEICNLLDYCL